MAIHHIESSTAPDLPPSPLSVAAVIWDYDGTLVDTRRSDEAAVARLLCGDPAATAGVERFWALEGRPLTERLELSWPGRAAEVQPLFDAEERPRVFAGVRRVMRALRDAGVLQAVVSSRRVEPLRRGLEAARLRGMVECVVGLESVGVCKPDPEGLHLALRVLALSPLAAVYVGDRDVDMEAARNAGIPGWHAAWSGSAVPLLAADRVPSPADVAARILGGLAG